MIKKIGLPIFRLFRDALVKWRHDDVPTQAAAITFYVVFTLIPLVSLFLALFRFFLGNEEALEVIANTIFVVAGPVVSDRFSEILAFVDSNGLQFENSFYSAFNIGLVIILSSGLLNQLSKTLDRIWGVKVHERTLLENIRQRAVSYVLIVAAAVLVFSTRIFTIIIDFIGQYIIFDRFASTIVTNIFVWVTLLFIFTTLFYVLISAQTEWSSMIIGASVAATLVVCSRFILSFFLHSNAITSITGVSGSLIALIFWIYYSAQLVLYGVEVSYVMQHRHAKQ